MSGAIASGRQDNAKAIVAPALESQTKVGAKKGNKMQNVQLTSSPATCHTPAKTKVNKVLPESGGKSGRSLYPKKLLS